MESIVLRGRHTHAGVEVLSFRLSLPNVESMPALTDFYEQMAERVTDFCQRELAPMAEGAYDADPDPKKRFHFRPYRYDLTGRVEEDDGTRLRVRLCARLVMSDGAQKSFCDEQIWEKGSGMLIKEKSHRQGSKKRKS